MGDLKCVYMRKSIIHGDVPVYCEDIDFLHYISRALAIYSQIDRLNSHLHHISQEVSTEIELLAEKSKGILESKQ